MDVLRAVGSLLYSRNLLPRQAEARGHAFNQAVADFTSSGAKNTGSRVLISTLVACVFTGDLVLGWLAVWAWNCWDGAAILEQGASLYTFSSLRVTRDLLGWVMGVPAGLKLNYPLSLFLGSRCLYLLRLWEAFYRDFLSLYLPLFLRFIPVFASFFGLSLTLALFHDLFKFLNLCHVCFFVFSSRLLSLQVSVLVSLSRLFRGKKWNALKNRVDSCDYNTNQLLLGTIVFTTLLFLLPTTIVFAALFLSLRILQWIVQFTLRAVVVGINWSTLSIVGWIERAGWAESLVKVRVSEGEVVWRGRRWEIGEIREAVRSADPKEIIAELLGKPPVDAKPHPLATISGLWTKL